MSDSIIEIKVPDIGDFVDVEIIEVLVKPGDSVDVDQDIITLESDKAAMEIPSPKAGTVRDLLVSVGDKVSENSVILTLQESSRGNKSEADTVKNQGQAAAIGKAFVAPMSTDKKSSEDFHCEVLVLGSGPGGYTAAFRAADLGKKVIMIERHDNIGGVCLNVGCIPSKTLLHTARVINEVKEMAAHGLKFGEPEIDIFRIKSWKKSVVSKLTGGLVKLAKARKIEVIKGEASFSDSHIMQVVTDDGLKTIWFDNCIIAAGSRATQISSFPNDDPRIMDSTDALGLGEIPDRLLVIGGGIIGLEMATVYDALGSDITVVERQDSLITGADQDIVRPLLKKLKDKYQQIYLSTKVEKIEPLAEEGLKVHFAGASAPETETFDKILVAVGRSPNGDLINAEAAGVAVETTGFIKVDDQMRTNIPYIYAIGDIVGQPMLAHKAMHEGKVAAEVISGIESAFDPMTIPSVAYTDPEVAWMGLSEQEAKAQGIDYVKGTFPWAASGRSLSLGRDEGITKALFSKDTGKIIGAGIVGPNAGELIAEAVLALEMGADAEDIGLAIHPHPTLSETLCFAAEVAEGTITDLMPPKKRLHHK